MNWDLVIVHIFYVRQIFHQQFCIFGCDCYTELGQRDNLACRRYNIFWDGNLCPAVITFIRQPDLFFPCLQVPHPSDRHDWMVTDDHLVGIILIECPYTIVCGKPGSALHRVVLPSKIRPVFNECLTLPLFLLSFLLSFFECFHH